MMLIKADGIGIIFVQNVSLSQNSLKRRAEKYDIESQMAEY